MLRHEDSAWHNVHIYMMKGQKSKEVRGEERGKAHFWVSSICLPGCCWLPLGGTYVSLPVYFRSLRLHSCTIRLKPTNVCHSWNEFFSSRGHCDSYYFFILILWLLNTNIWNYKIKDWVFPDFLFCKALWFVFRSTLSFCQLRFLSGYGLIIKKFFFVVRVNQSPHNIYSLIVVL